MERTIRENRISQTVLKVTLALITLSIKSDWSERLPQGLVGLTEKLLLTSGAVSSNSRFVFTHAIPQERKLLQLILKLVGEPFRSSVTSRELPGYLATSGWKVISDIDEAIAHGIERYAVAQRERTNSGVTAPCERRQVIPLM